jgi:signal transduction histidine kinase
MVEELGLSEALSTWVTLMDSVLPMKLVFVGASSGFTLRNTSAGVHVYRIAQESIQNAIKHSQAGLIEVFLDAQDENLVLTVQDNGKGKVEGRAIVRAGFGISNMRFRSQLLHAQLTFCENEPQGVKVRCEIPSVLSPIK